MVQIFIYSTTPQNGRFSLDGKARQGRSQSVLRKGDAWERRPGQGLTMDKSGSNKAAIDEINSDREMPIEVRQIKYLNNIVEQDHHFIKRIVRPMLNFKSFYSARNVLAGIELMHMIRKGQMAEENQMSFAKQFYALAE